MSVEGALLLPPELEARLGRLGLEFLADFLGRAAARHPEDFDTLAELATTLTRLGRLEEGLAADLRLVVLAPRDPTVHYNLACSLALLGRTGEALEALERAIGFGYSDRAHLVADDDLAALRPRPEFQRLLARLAE